MTVNNIDILCASMFTKTVICVILTCITLYILLQVPREAHNFPVGVLTIRKCTMQSFDDNDGSHEKTS